MIFKLFLLYLQCSISSLTVQFFTTLLILYLSPLREIWPASSWLDFYSNHWSVNTGILLFEHRFICACFHVASQSVQHLRWLQVITSSLYTVYLARLATMHTTITVSILYQSVIFSIQSKNVFLLVPLPAPCVPEMKLKFQECHTTCDNHL